VRRDNVEWTQDQEAAARRKVLENSDPLPAEKQGGCPAVRQETDLTSDLVR